MSLTADLTFDHLSRVRLSFKNPNVKRATATTISAFISWKIVEAAQTCHVFWSLSFEFICFLHAKYKNCQKMLNHVHKFLWDFVEGWVSQLISLLTTPAVYGCQSQGSPTLCFSRAHTFIVAGPFLLDLPLWQCIAGLDREMSGQLSTAAKETLKSSGAGRQSKSKTHFWASDLGGHQFDRPKADDLRPRSSASGLKGVVLCERACFRLFKHLLDAFYRTLSSKNPSKNLVSTENPCRCLLRRVLLHDPLVCCAHPIVGILRVRQRSQTKPRLKKSQKESPGGVSEGCWPAPKNESPGDSASQEAPVFKAFSPNKSLFFTVKETSPPPPPQIPSRHPRPLPPSPSPARSPSWDFQ